MTTATVRPPGGVQSPAERSRDFKRSAVRLVKCLAPQRVTAVAVIALSVCGTAIGVVVPRILGHATDLLFNGVIGRQLPAGVTKDQAVAAARARGNNAFADLLSGMNVVPSQGVNFAAVAQTLALALVMYLLAALLIWAQARLLNLTVQRTLQALRSDVEEKVHRLPLTYFDTRQRGEVLSRVTNDVDNVQTSLSMTISQLLTAVLTVTTVLVMMLTISPLLTGITLLTVPLSLLATRAIARRSQRLFVAQWTNTGRLNAHIEETYSGFTLVKTFGHRARAEDQFRELNEDVYHAGLGAQFFSGLISPATTFIGNLSYVAVAVVGGVQVATGQITVGGIQAFIQYVRQFNGPLGQVAGMYNALQSGVASAERIFDLLDEPEESSDHEPVPLSLNGQGPRGDDAGRSSAREGAAQAHHRGDDAGRSSAREGAAQAHHRGDDAGRSSAREGAAQSSHRGDDAGRSSARGGAAQAHHRGDDAGRSSARGGAAQAKPSGRVEFEHVSFGYRPDTPVIDDLSLIAEPGSTVAIVGATGVGKTTLVNLLMRFYDPNSGRILVDGVDIASVSRHSLRSRIGMVLQDTWLFDGTVAENIAYGQPGASEDEVVQAARAAYVDRFVHTLPDGYQTRVSDDGGNISAGEKQLITIARAFIARPQLLILDEATSSVDTRTELLIAQATHELRRDRTSFIIAHRLSTVRDADLILVMKTGRIVEQGNHDELLARRGAYWEMAQT